MNDDDQQQFAPLLVDRSVDNDSKDVGDDFGSVIEADRTLARKMALVNNAIDEIGFTSYQMKLFFLNGFGYAVDSLLILLIVLTQSQITLQYHPVIITTQIIAAGIGLLFGALFWGLGADASLLFLCENT